MNPNDPKFYECKADERYWQVQPAPQKAVDIILAKPAGEGLDNRSNWMWIRLPNGDLVLATYPQGDTYFETEHLRSV